jgi:N-acetylated-alpha-linked acidic dipeptidase
MTVLKSIAVLLLSALSASPPPKQSHVQNFAEADSAVFGYADFSKEAKIEETFLSVPDAAQAGLHLKVLVAEPHLAATPEDRKTAEYVAANFRAAGLETSIVPYRVLLNRPVEVRVEAWDAAGKLLMSGPTREHLQGDAAADDARVVTAFHGSSGSGDITAEVVYANYGRLQDFDYLASQKIDLHGKIVLMRYGANFRGVKVYLAEQRGAAGVLIYSDPQDDGYAKGDAWPIGAWRPETAVQRGSVQYLFKYPGDPTTPGVASTAGLPDSARQAYKDEPGKTGNQPYIPSIPISFHDASPILEAMKGLEAPQAWQGALPFRYHLGSDAAAGVKVHIVSRQDYQLRTIWDVVGKIKGDRYPAEWVVVGNHRDAWAYGAVDPASGTAAMLEAVHGVGALLRRGWRPRRTIIFCSWDAEEEGLVGSTEWVEQNQAALQKAVAYFNTDIAVSGVRFSAGAVPSLKEFLRQVTSAVPSPLGGTVYDQWRINKDENPEHRVSNAPSGADEVSVADLGSGTDYTPFFQHAGVPSTDISSEGPYGVYHSAFDDYDWYVANADPHFLYLQQMARVLGLEALRMADADVLPYDYVDYAQEISAYLEDARKKAGEAGLRALDFSPAEASLARLAAAAEKVHKLQMAPAGDLARLNRILRQTEAALLSDAGLPGRTWYKHTIFAPGERTGYTAVAIPGVNDAIDARDASRAVQQLAVLAQALDRAARILDSAR